MSPRSVAGAHWDFSYRKVCWLGGIPPRELANFGPPLEFERKSFEPALIRL